MENREMGEWSKCEYDRSELPSRCFIFAGMTPNVLIEKILRNFQKVLYTKHDNYNPYIVEYEKEEITLIFQVYGAAMIADILKILKDGNTKEIIFIGSAYGISTDLHVGDCVISEKVQCLDGITNLLDNVEYAYPNMILTKKIGQLIATEMTCKTGKTVSVPTTFWHPDHNRFDKDAIALEMEYSAFCYFSMKLAMDVSGILVISDTIEHSLLDDRSLRYNNILKAFELVLAKFEVVKD